MSPGGPRDVIWDVTYACPLRCTHCYSESGRRPSRQLGRDDLLAVTDALIALRPDSVALAGGEPLLVREIIEVAGRLSGAGIAVVLYTSGWTLEASVVAKLARVVAEVHVSIDGATPEVHDGIRGRAGSFQRAMRALSWLDGAARRAGEQGAKALPFGVDWVVTRTNHHQMADFCSLITGRFPELKFMSFGAVVPSGLASRRGFSDHELLADDQARRLGNGEQARLLRALVPPRVEVTTTDNLVLQMHPDLVARGLVLPVMQVEPDGAVRAMPIYEGTVGNLLTEPAATLWQRCVARWRDPFVTATLSPVRTMEGWAAATRLIDEHFGSEEVRVRIARRPAYTDRTPAGACA